MKNSLPSISLVYLAGFMQGIALILFPAGGPIFTDPNFHGLSSSQYGLLFTPQIILAILASFSAPLAAKKWGMKKVLQLGLLSNLLSMLFLTGSHFVLGREVLPFLGLLLGTSALGLGFGFTITAVNPYAYSFFPGKEASAVTSLHILLGLGTAISSILLDFFSDQGIWWGASAVAATILLLLWLWMFSLDMPLKLESPDTTDTSTGIPRRLWLFFLLIFLYGACEASFGNWAPIYLEKEAGLSLSGAALGLSLFWGAIALGRLLFTLAALRFQLRSLHILMPLIVASVFLTIPFIEGAMANYVALVLAGLGLSFYFPYSISLATDEFPAYSATASGMLVAAIQLGTGVSANIIGWLNGTYSLGNIIQFSALYALIISLIAGYLFFTTNKALKVKAA